MRQINSVVSALYGFSNDGPFPETPVALYSPTAAECIEHMGNKDMFTLAQNYILLDRLSYIADIVETESCPKCNFEKAGSLVPEVFPPYINYLQKTSLASISARNVISTLNRLTIKKDVGKAKVMIFVNNSEFNFLEMAN